MRRSILCLAMVIAIPHPAAAKPVTPVDALAFAPGTPLRVDGVDVLFGVAFEPVREKLDEKAARKREDDGLPPLDRESYATVPETTDRYATLPFKQMFPYVLRDKVLDEGLSDGRPVRLRVTFDRMKTADFAIATLVGSYDALLGTVEVLDGADQAPLGSFRVEIVSPREGWAAMAVRGWGVRERLAEQFSEETVRYLAGRKRSALRTALIGG